MEGEKTKQCPYCKTHIDTVAVKCPNCQSELKWYRKKLNYAAALLIIIGIFGIIILVSLK